MKILLEKTSIIKKHQSDRLSFWMLIKYIS